MENNQELRRYLEPVEGLRMVDYHTLLSAAETHGCEDDFTKLGSLIEKDIVILPTYMTDNAVGCDCFASEDVTIKPGAIKVVPTGFKALFDGTSEGLFPFIRSSIPKKKSLLLANGVGVIESDYYGNSDNDGNIGFMFYNFSTEDVFIKRFERIGQLVILPIKRFYNASYAHKTRGASGSTGN